MSTKSIGKYYEQRAKYFLIKQGYKIIEENWQCGKLGEIDFIIKDQNRFDKEYLVFVEVKYRAYDIRSAMLAVNYKKQMQLKKLSSMYLKIKNIQEGSQNISYDVIAISPEQIEHVQNIFNY
jgi:putative endonuclease